ncbi:hypothetical protein AMTR_s00086p00059270, partial [Amborella trichopoda]
ETLPCPHGENGDIDEDEKPQSRRLARGKEPASSAISSHGGKVDRRLSPPRTTPVAQPTIKSVLTWEKAIEKSHMIVAQWMYISSIPFSTSTLSIFSLSWCNDIHKPR